MQFRNERNVLGLKFLVEIRFLKETYLSTNFGWKST